MKKIFLLLIGFLLLTACNNHKGIDAVETVKDCKANIIAKDQVVDMLYSKGLKEVQFVDIRTPHQYANGHLQGAVNIPMKNFFNPYYFSKLKKDAVLMLYGAEASTPRLMALMAGHFNKGNFYVILGGYDYLKGKILDNYGINSGLYDDEEPLVDYQQFINELRSRAGAGAPVAKSKPAATGKPIVKHKKKEVTGGCG